MINTHIHEGLSKKFCKLIYQLQNIVKIHVSLHQ